MVSQAYSTSLPVAGAALAFQTSTANAWGASFLRHLQADMDRCELARSQQLLERVSRQAQALFDTHRSRLSDGPSYTVLGVCALLVAACRELQNELGHAASVRQMVERSFSQTYQAFIQNICKPLLMQARRSPQTLMQMNFKAWGETLFPGQTVWGAQARGQEDTGYRRCLQRLGEPGLASIIQQCDQAWIEAVAACGASPLGERRRTRATDQGGAPETGFVPFQFGPQAGRQRERHAAQVLELQLPRRGDRRRPAAGGARSRYADGIDRRQSARRQNEVAFWG